MGRVLAWPAVLLAAAVALMSAPTSAAATTARTSAAVADVEIFSAYYTFAPAGWSYTVFDVTLVNRGPDWSAGVVLRLTGLDTSLRGGWGYGFPDTCQFLADGARCTFENALGNTTFKVPVCTSDRPVDITVTTSSTDPDLSNNTMHAPGVPPEGSVGLAQCPAYAGTPTPTTRPVRTTTRPPGNPGGTGGSGGGGSGPGGSGTGAGSGAGPQAPGTTPTPPPAGSGSTPSSVTEDPITGAATRNGAGSSAAARPTGSWGLAVAGVVGAVAVVVAALVGWRMWRRRTAGNPGS
jgi:hypothetical protein